MNDENNDVIKSIDGVLYYKYDYTDFLYQKLEDFKSRIDKAIDYIKWQQGNPQYDNLWRKYECDELIKILKGDDENEK